MKKFSPPGQFGQMNQATVNPNPSPNNTTDAPSTSFSSLTAAGKQAKGDSPAGIAQIDRNGNENLFGNKTAKAFSGSPATTRVPGWRRRPKSGPPQGTARAQSTVNPNPSPSAGRGSPNQTSTDRGYRGSSEKFGGKAPSGVRGIRRANQHPGNNPNGRFKGAPPTMISKDDVKRMTGTMPRLGAPNQFGAKSMVAAAKVPLLHRSAGIPQSSTGAHVAAAGERVSPSPNAPSGVTNRTGQPSFRRM